MTLAETCPWSEGGGRGISVPLAFMADWAVLLLPRVINTTLSVSDPQQRPT